MMDAVHTARDLLSATLADRLVVTLDDRRFAPTAAQLAWVDGGDRIAGSQDGPLARIVPGRYAALFADHVIDYVAVDGAPGAYIRILECAHQAFLPSLSLGTPPDGDALRWENEGGATIDAGTRSQGAVAARGQRVAVC